MIFSVMRTFLPWLMYYFFYHFCGLTIVISATLTLIFYIVIAHRDLAQGFIVSWLSPIFLSFIILNARFYHLLMFQHYPAGFFYASLAAISWGSIVIRRPFTVQYSRIDVPQDKWQHPIFIRINYILSFCWSLIFSANCIINFLQPSLGSLRFLTSAFTILGLYITLVFPNWYRETYRDRSLRISNRAGLLDWARASLSQKRVERDDNAS